MRYDIQISNDQMCKKEGLDLSYHKALIQAKSLAGLGWKVRIIEIAEKGQRQKIISEYQPHSNRADRWKYDHLGNRIFDYI